MKMKHSTGRRVLLLLLLTIVSCNPFKADVYNVVKSTYDSGIDTIDFGESLWFDWDTMYWFPSNIPLEEINSMVNINGFWRDVGDRLVFVKKNKIVYYNEFFPNHETPMERVCIDPYSVQVIRKEDASFLIRKVSDKLYILSQTRCQSPSKSVKSDNKDNFVLNKKVDLTNEQSPQNSTK